MKLPTSLCAIAMLGGFAPASASAATYISTGSLDLSDPTFARPSSTLGASGFNPHYDMVGFTVDTAGTYSFTLTSGAFDTVLVLYRPTFDAKASGSNIVAFSDDAAPPATDSGFAPVLSAGTNYVAILTSYGNAGLGSYAFRISGPGNIDATSAASAIPEPASWMLLIVGMGIVGYMLRSRRVDIRTTAAAA